MRSRGAKTVAKVEGLNQLLAQFRAKADAAGKGVKATVGYGAAYSVVVHEDMEARHTTGQAKFLETPARTLQPVLAGIIAQALREGKTMKEAVLLAAERLKVESQALCPVLSGFLRDSAFVRLEEGNG